MHLVIYINNIALAGFQGSCTQTYFSLVVDKVLFENSNTKMKVTMDYDYIINSTLNTRYTSQWTRVKVTFIVISTQFEGYPTTTGSTYIWAG